MKKLIILLALAFPLLANPTLFTHYEGMRQGLLKNSLPETKKHAAALAAQAEKAKLGTIAEFAQAVTVARNLTDARRSFGVLSEQMIKLQGRPAVYHCPMVKKSWLQKKGKVGNPYDPSMATCGVLKAE